MHKGPQVRKNDTLAAVCMKLERFAVARLCKSLYTILMILEMKIKQGSDMVKLWISV